MARMAVRDDLTVEMAFYNKNHGNLEQSQTKRLVRILIPLYRFSRSRGS